MFNAAVGSQCVYLSKVRHGVARLIAPVDGDDEDLVRSLQRDKLCAQIDPSAAIDILEY